MSFTGISNHTAMFRILLSFSNVLFLLLAAWGFWLGAFGLHIRESFQDFANGGDGKAVPHEVPLLPQAHSVGKSEPLGEMEQPCDFLRRKASHPACASQVRSRMHERPAV